MSEVEAKLYEWFRKQKPKNLPVTGKLIKAKAKYINEHFKDKNAFNASGYKILTVDSEYDFLKYPLIEYRICGSICAVITT